jgi:hypothetical protein
MRKVSKGGGGLILTVIALLLAYHFRAQILAWLQASPLAPLLGAVAGPPGSLTTPASVGGVTRLEGDSGGENNATSGGFMSVGLPPAGSRLTDPGGFTGFIGSGGGAIDYGYTAAGNPLTGPVANSFGRCSTHLTDGKPLCG